MSGRVCIFVFSFVYSFVFSLVFSLVSQNCVQCCIETFAIVLCEVLRVIFSDGLLSQSLNSNV